MPRIELEGDFTSDYSTGKMTITDTTNQKQVYTVKARYRGQTAMTYTKKSFSIKIVDDQGEKKNVSLLGMRDDNSWILDAMAVDRSRMRNRVSFDLWSDFASDNYIKQQFGKKSKQSIDGRYVELYLNGNYHGLYLLTEKIDRKQLKLRKYDDDGIHGVLYKAEGYYGTAFWDQADYDNTQSTWCDWESSYPDVEELGQTDYGPLADAIDFTLNSTDSAFAAEATSRFDLPVWIDHLLLINLINGKDNYAKNTFVWIYDIDQSHKLGISPWDMDGTWGRMPNGSLSDIDDTLFYHNVVVRLMQCFPNFKQTLSDRYFELRKTWFNTDSLKHRFQHYQTLFDSNETFKRDSCLWDNIDGVSLNLNDEISYICQWIEQRVEFLDNYFEHLPSDIAVTHRKEYSTDTVYNIEGQRMSTSSLPRGIYISKGKKFVVK